MASRANVARFGADDERARASLVEATAERVGAAGGPGGLALDLFGRVPVDDLAGYDAGSLVELALSAREHLATAGAVGPTGSVRLRDHVVVRDGRTLEVTVVEAVNRDKPFLLDSTLSELAIRGLTPSLVAHPILGVDREPGGAVVEVVGEATAARDPDLARESLIHLHLERLDDPSVRSGIVTALAATYADVTRVADDRDAMWARLSRLAACHRAARGDPEAAAFLEWLADGHFVLLGVDEGPRPDAGTAPEHPLTLGVPGTEDRGLRAADRDFLAGGAALTVAKAATLSRVHRSARLDVVRVRRPSAHGEVVGLTRVLGLFTASAYTAPARQIPMIRTKAAAVVERAGLDPTSHAGRTLLTVLDAYPRDDLFQVEADVLVGFALGIVGLADRPRVRVLHRIDRTAGFATALVYTFKDRTDASVRARVGTYLATAFGGEVVEAQADFPEGVLTRTRYVVALDGRGAPDPDRALIEDGVAAITRTWGDELRVILSEAMEGRRSRILASRYADAFSAAYRERFPPRAALGDVAIIEGLSEAAPRAVDLGRRHGDGPAQMRLQVFSLGRSLPLSDRVPVLEDLGFRVIDERTYSVRRADASPADQVWIHDMLIERATGAPVDVDALAARLRDTLLALSDGMVESDGFNRLVLEAGLDWREAALMRALGRYLRQLQVRYGQDYMAAALAAQPAVTADLVALFRARFDPDVGGDRAGAQAQVRARLEAGLATVASLDDDRILRRFLNLVEAAVRTNAFQADPAGRPREVVAIKFACAEVVGMPLPRPLFETFVTSPRVEGVHLRFGHVARGGLRWSDRPEDLRTEILGLAKAQQVKNAVIVPVGAKGGFVAKQAAPSSDRRARATEGEAAYRLFVGALLDVTDNIVGEAIVPPPGTVRHDGDDAYLVVAADKGTATFSDLANAISLGRGHWLGDAFASGGSHGYDHKAMGITARGAWESVERHFSEFDVDVGREPVTVAGVGDMSGDVFGNGMLLSRSLRLVAAFDHRHVFLDPTPDPASSFDERARLFALGPSSWADYDATLLSPGGGVFPRSSKSVRLSSQAKAALGVDFDEASPSELIQAILRAPVDLLWFGGVGTYVRADVEGDDQVGDRANDALRITATELRAKVIGEGANLALTQRARVEAARGGVRLNTDAIDNSAGVNTSDVEVNIKVALMAAERDGRLDGAGRDALLAGMTDEVATHVLRNNAAQTLALSLATRREAGETSFVARTMQVLEAEGRLRRDLESLPDDDALAQRLLLGEGMTRPEFAIVMAYAKGSLHDALLASPLPDDAHLAGDLRRYFPKALRSRFPDEVDGHRLRREIVATILANAVINDCGPTVVSRLADETGADPPSIARAYVVARDAFGTGRLREAIDELDPKPSSQAHLALRDDARHLLVGLLSRILRGSALDGDLGEAVSRRADAVTQLLAALPDLLGEGWATNAAREADLLRRGLGRGAARMLAAPRAVSEMPVIVDVAEREGLSVHEVASIHFDVERSFDLGALAAAVQATPARDDYDRIALARAFNALAHAHREITVHVLRAFGSGHPAIERWREARADAIARVLQPLRRIIGSELTVAKATVAADLLSDLADG